MDRKKEADGTKERSIYWSTCFKSIIKFNKREQNLNKSARITFSRPPTLSKILTNYKTISQNQTKTKNIGCSKGCGKCALCGNFKGFETMVTTTDKIKTKDGRIFKLKQELDCKDFGIYVAQCTTCQETYVGQTVTSFSKRCPPFYMEKNGGWNINKTG